MVKCQNATCRADIKAFDWAFFNLSISLNINTIIKEKKDKNKKINININKIKTSHCQD